VGITLTQRKDFHLKIRKVSSVNASYYYKCKCTGEGNCPCALTEHHAMKAYWGMEV
jgi:hypothetical protein